MKGCLVDKRNNSFWNSSETFEKATNGLQPVSDLSVVRCNAEMENQTLDDLFKKTRAKPHIYYLPLTEQDIAVKLAARAQGPLVKPAVKA